MNKAIWFFLPLLLLFSQGCVTYPVVGSFDEYNEIFKGTVTECVFTGSSEIKVECVNTKTRGKGSSWVTYIPPTLGPAGIKGEALLTFDDGRVVKAEYVCLSGSTGWGSGKDQSGSTFTFTFGMTEQEAQEYIEKMSKTVAYRPDLPSPQSKWVDTLSKPENLEPAGGEPPKHDQETAKSGISPKVSEPIEFEYDAETKTGYISVKGKGPEARSWMLKQIEEICASKNIIIQEGTTSEPARFRVLDETFMDGKFTIKFELVR
jgi:hypothetical protein